MHQLVNVQALVDVDLEATLDEGADLLVNGLPLRLPEIEDWPLLGHHLERDSADDKRVQDDTSAPHVRLVRYLEGPVGIFLLVQDFGRQVDSIDTAHLVLQAEMLRHVY